MNKVEPANTASNQVTELSEGNQITFDDIKKKLVASKELRNEKIKEYYESMAFGYKQWSVLGKKEDISVSKYDPDTEKKAKEEYKKASKE
ncbi:hypothetical protein QVD99_004410 [Batrachochytrium dendrobatidis]|nr:hypothetical protein QVD99_004410 [Batrachochytrium dendrobatidis]